MPHLLATLLIWLSLTTLAPSQPAGTLNSPNWATGYIWAQPGTTVSTTITNRQPLPNDINVFAGGPITTWNITFPNPPFDGEIISIGCPSATVGTITLSSTDGSTVAPAGVTSCSSIGTILTYQFNYYANTWYNISAPTVTGSDNFGTITAGGGTLTSCVINFGTAWTTALACSVSFGTAALAVTVATSTTQLTVGATSLSGYNIFYTCGSISMRDPANDNNLFKEMAA